MHLMFILSTPTLQRLKSSNYHLTLPHLYGDEDYVKTYRRFSLDGDFVMQDNSVFELKKTIEGDLIEYAERVCASEIVLPEVLRDRKASMDRINGFMRSKRFQECKSDFKWAAVLQGASYHELTIHYKQLLKLVEKRMLHTICIPFNYEFDAYGGMDRTRLHAGWNRFSHIERMVEMRVWNGRVAHHLLGLFNPAELSMYRDIPGIRSNDSSSCFWHSLYGVIMTQDQGLVFEKIERHVDFTVDYTNAMQSTLFAKNRTLLQGFSNGIGGGAIRRMYEKFKQEALA